MSDEKENPILTTIGSSNFNARSLDRDLELQSFLVTGCPELSQRIKEVIRLCKGYFCFVYSLNVECAEPGVYFCRVDTGGFLNVSVFRATCLSSRQSRNQSHPQYALNTLIETHPKSPE